MTLVYCQSQAAYREAEQESEGRGLQEHVVYFVIRLWRLFPCLAETDYHLASLAVKRGG